ncbi:hypothetical protein G6F57_016836 [Rhizopus arrhizus]|nr:hypothetical protein G6F57_016836 [Rhizopus arrhizus]
MDQPFRADTHALHCQRRRVAGLQGQQGQVGAAGEAGDVVRQRHHGRLGHPRHAAIQHPLAIGLPGADLQGLDARQEFHGVGQRGGAGVFAGQQRPHPGVGQGRIRAAQQVFDEDALAPGHEGAGDRPLGHLGHGLDRIADVGARQTALIRRHADSEEARVGQPGQHRGGVQAAVVQGIGMLVQPCRQVRGQAPARGGDCAKRLPRHHAPLQA